MSEETSTQTAPADTTTQPESTPSDNGVAGALRALAESKGFEYVGDDAPAAPTGDVPDPDEAPPAADASKEPAKPAVAPKEVPLDKYARMEAKAREAEAKARAAEQRAAEIERQRNEDEAAWKADPLAALHRRGLSTTDLNKRALDLGEPKPAEPAEELPAWAQELKRKNDELEAWRNQQTQQAQEQARQAALAGQVDVLKNHLSKFDEFSLVNELGAHDVVLKRITEHLAGGRFEDEEQAATVIAAIAREEESRLQTELRGYLAKPKSRAFLERELKGKQSEENPRPARTPGLRTSNPARPASSEQAAHRTTLRPAPDETGWSREESMQRALEEARALRAG